MANGSRWQSRPVFLTSTFRDMHAERDWLRNHVLPVLEERLRARQHHLETIDLRWGVDTASLDATSEQAREFQVLKVCLDEIERSRPFLIGLIGDRYGWLPPADRMAAAAAEAGFDGSVAGKSVTELEIDYGVLSAASQDQHCLFYLRDPLPYDDMPPEVAAQYSDVHAAGPEAADAERKLSALKSRLKRDLPDRVRPYRVTWDHTSNRVTGLEAWGEQVLEDLWRELDAETASFARDAPPSPFEADRWELEAFIEDRGRDFRGRTALLERLNGFAASPAGEDTQNLICITGAPGAGKSALFAAMCASLRDAPVFLLAHAAGISPRATQIDTMLRRWIAEMAAALGQEVPLAKDSAPDEIDEAFSRLLNRISAQRPVVVLIDALNQFEPTTRARHLTWLPRRWPQNARLIATAIPGSQSEALEKRQRAILCALPDLSESEATEIARAVCARYHRSIGADVLKALLGRRLEDGALSTGNPLWLELAVEALNLLDADDFARMDLQGSGTPEERLQQLLIATIEEMPAGVADLYGWMLERAESLHGVAWARAFVSLIAISRAGWRELDLQSLMPALSGESWDSLKFAALRRTFRAHVISRGAQAQWDFTHAQMREAVRRRYFREAAVTRDAHRNAADHLLGLPSDDPLRATETMFHLIGADDRPGAAHYYGGVLTDPEAAGAKSVLAEYVVAGGESAASLEWVLSLLDDGLVDDDTRGWLCSRFNFDLAGALTGVAGVEVRLAIARRTQSTMQVLVDREPDVLTRQRSLSVSHETVGDALLAMGDAPAALAAYRQSRSVSAASAAKGPRNPVWQNDLSACHDKIGDILISQGDVAGALNAYRASLAISENLMRDDPRSSEWRRNLAIAHSKIGDVLAADGDAAESLLSYQQSLSHREALVESDPSDLALQRDLGVGYERYGLALEVTGDLDGAFATHRTALNVRQRLAQRDPADAGWQLDISVSQRRIGNVLELQGDGRAAQPWYRDALEICENLTRLDSSNVHWRRHYCTASLELGRVLNTAGACEEALGLLRTSLQISESLAAEYPDNLRWKHDMSVAHIGIGDVYRSLGEDEDAVQAYRASVSISEALCEANADNADWQRRLLIANARLGDILLKQQDREGGLAAQQASLAIGLRLSARDPANTGLSRDLLLSHVKVGDALVMQLDWERALSEFRAAQEIAKRLVDRDPANALWRNGLWMCFGKVAFALRMSGDPMAELETYRDQLSVSTRLAALIPEQSDIVRQQLSGHTKTGECLAKQGDWAGAVAAHREALAAIERIKAIEPDDAQLRRDRLTAEKTIGDLLQESGDLAAALAHCQQAREIGERLIADNPEDTDGQQTLLEIHRKIGDLHLAQDDGAGACAAYRAASALAQPLVNGLGPQAALLSDLMLDHSNIGHVMHGEAVRLLDAGEDTGAVALLGEAIAHFRLALAAKNREDAPTEWGLRQTKLGSALLELGKRSNSVDVLYEAEQAIRLALEELSPEGDQHNVAACHYNLGEVFQHRGEQDRDREILEKSIEAFTRALSAFEATGNRALAEQAERNRGTVQALLETYIG